VLIKFYRQGAKTPSNALKTKKLCGWRGRNSLDNIFARVRKKCVMYLTAKSLELFWKNSSAWRSPWRFGALAVDWVCDVIP
jgi:hypothetical protein